MPSEITRHENRDTVAIDDASLARLARTVVATLSIALDGRLLSANTNLRRLLGVNSLSVLLARDFKTEILANAADWEYWERAKSRRRITIAKLALKSADGRTVLLKGDVWYVAGHNKGVDHFFCAFSDLTRSPQIDTTVRRAVARMNVPEDALPTGNETILLLTEDAALSATVRSGLEGLGYEVVMSRLLNEAPDSPRLPSCDLVIIDSAVSDGIGSIQIVATIHIDEPQYGYLIERPFSLHQLATAVRRALDGLPNG